MNAQSYPFWSDDQIRFSDVDAVGHANNNAIGAIFEMSRVCLLREIGISQTSQEIQCVLARLVLEFKAELKMFEKVKIGDKVTKIGNSSFTLQSGLFVEREGEMLCAATCEAVCVLVEATQHKSTPIPALVREKLEDYA